MLLAITVAIWSKQRQASLLRKEQREQAALLEQQRREQAALLDKEERERRLAQERLRREAAEIYDSIIEVVDALVDKHERTLVAKRRQAIYCDDYGRFIFDKWASELDYFFEHIIVPELSETADIDEIRSVLELDWITNKSSEEACAYAEEFGTIDGFFSRQIKLHVSARCSLADERTNVAVDVSEMTPREYEEFCAKELELGGWDARVLGGAGDQGVDIVAEKAGIVLVVQCKLYSSPLGNKPVQEIHTGRQFYSADVAAVASNASYTPGARAAARQTGVLLLHHSDLSDLERHIQEGDGLLL